MHAPRSKLYAWNRRNGDALLPINRDQASIPPAASAARAQFERARVDAAMGSQRGKVLRTAVAHAQSVWTWHSLVVEQTLRPAEAVDLASSLVRAAGRS